MVAVNFSLTQTVIDTTNVLRSQSSSPDTLSSIFDNLIKVDYLISTNYFYYSSVSYVGSTLRLNFLGGSKLIISKFNQNRHTSQDSIILNK